MIDLTFTVNVDGATRELRVVADQLDDPRWLDDVLRAYDKEYLRPRIADRFETRPGWAPRADTTNQRLTARAAADRQRGESILRKKLARDVVRAKRNLDKLLGPGGLAKASASQAALYERQRVKLEALAGNTELADAHAAARARRRLLTMKAPHVSTAIASRMRAVEARKAVLAEFERLAAGGDRSKTILTARQTESLAGQLDRATAAGREKPLLGKIAQSLKTEISGGTLRDGSEIPWSGVQNEGGTVGHGAKLPARPFAYLEEVDLRVLVEYIRDRLGDSGSAHLV